MNKRQKIQYFFKKCLDRIFSALFLIIFLPIILIISLLIKLDSKGPVIFKQKRLGRNGKEFIIYKFRTMCDNAINRGTGIFTSNNDPRITKIGKLLRKTSLDEILQLVNIFRGEMSFIGPRPPLPDHPYTYEKYSYSQKKRFQILPGITGYAQAYGRNSLEWPERIQMDVFYLENFSLLLDIKILINTIFTVAFSKGVYSNRNTKEKISDSNTK